MAGVSACYVDHRKNHCNTDMSISEHILAELFGLYN